MNEQWLKVKEWYAQLLPREKRAVDAGGVAAGIFLVYLLLWAPLNNYVDALRGKIKTEQKTLVWMQAADKEMAKYESHAQSKSKSMTPVMMLGLLQKQINHAALGQQLSQLKQASSDTIEIHFQKVSFDKVVVLLTTLIKESNVAIAHMSVTGEATPGIVTADITLKLI